jgi:hypothetical protein
MPLPSTPMTFSPSSRYPSPLPLFRSLSKAFATSSRLDSENNLYQEMDTIDGLPTDKVNVRAKLIHAVHGWLNGASSDAASLIVVDLCHGSRRVQQAEIHIRLEASASSGRDRYASDFRNLEQYWDDETEEPDPYNVGNSRTIEAKKVAPGEAVRLRCESHYLHFDLPLLG